MMMILHTSTFSATYYKQKVMITQTAKNARLGHYGRNGHYPRVVTVATVVTGGL